MGDDLYRVESAVSATSSGDLTWEKWPHDVATALGFAGQRNPLGFALVRYLSDEPPSSALVWDVVMRLETALLKAGCPREVSNKMAFDGFDFWRHRRCRACLGRGIDRQSKTNQPCPTCKGTGERPLPAGPEMLRTAISLLNEAEQWMEGQLASRLKRS